VTENTREAQQDRQVNADNLQHFGEPVYDYDLGQGIEDGYLAACEIVRGRVDIDDTGLSLEDVLAHNPVNALTGEPVSREQLQALYELA
jgi:type I restriction enzyme R subunit